MSLYVIFLLDDIEEEIVKLGVEIKIAANGRMVIPLDVRRKLGLENGGSVWLESDATATVLRTRRQRLASARALAQEMLQGVEGSAVDDLIATRRDEFHAEMRDR